MMRFGLPHVPRLSVVVGPGTDASTSSSMIRVRVINRDEALTLLQLRLTVLNMDHRIMAQAHFSKLLPRRSAQDIHACVHWDSGALSIESDAPATFSTTSVPRMIHVLRAELMGPDGTAYDVLEIGVRSADVVSGTTALGLSS